jgi:hypothetical protein
VEPETAEAKSPSTDRAGLHAYGNGVSDLGPYFT